MKDMEMEVLVLQSQAQSNSSQKLNDLIADLEDAMEKEIEREYNEEIAQNPPTDQQIVEERKNAKEIADQSMKMTELLDRMSTCVETLKTSDHQITNSLQHHQNLHNINAPQPQLTILHH